MVMGAGQLVSATGQRVRISGHHVAAPMPSGQMVVFTAEQWVASTPQLVTSAGQLVLMMSEHSVVASVQQWVAMPAQLVIGSGQDVMSFVHTVHTARSVEHMVAVAAASHGQRVGSCGHQVVSTGHRVATLSGHTVSMNGHHVALLGHSVCH